MQKWTSRIETPIKAELICYEVNGIHIVFGVTEENQLKLFHFSWKECGKLRLRRASSWCR